MFGGSLRLSGASIAAFIISVIAGLLFSQAGLISSILGFPTPSGSAPSILLQIIHSAVIVIGVYCAVAAVLVTITVSADLLTIRDELMLLISTGKAAQLKAGDWHMIFFGAVAEPLGFRLVAKGQDAGNGLFCVGTPFLTASARREVWKFYRRSLGICQVWTVLGCLILADGALSIGKTFDVFQAIRPSTQPLLGEVILSVVLFVGISFIAASEMFERLLDTLSSFPFKLESSLKMDALATRLHGHRESLAIQSPTLMSMAGERTQTDRSEIAAGVAPLDPGAFKIWVEDVVSSLIGAVDQKLAAPLQAAENLLAASSTSTIRLDEQLVVISQTLRDGLLSQREDIMRSIEAAQGNANDSVQQLAAALHSLLEEISQRPLERPNQNGPNLAASIETFSRLISPVLKGLEATDSRLLSAVERQEDVLAKLGQLIAKLTGTLVSVEKAIRIENSPVLQEDSYYAESVKELLQHHTAESDEIVHELHSLLDELDYASKDQD